MLAYWYQALSARYGIILDVRKGAPQTVMSQLYNARKSAHDPALADLCILRTMVNPTYLYIIKKELTDGNRSAPVPATVESEPD